MTPKEKANELVVKFMRYVPADESMELPYAKQCALIAVDEISQVVKMCIPYLNKETYISYWDEVKTEIEEL